MKIGERFERVLTERISKSRQNTFRRALELFEGETLVEIGTLREWESGGSTYILALAAVVQSGLLISIDVDEKQLVLASSSLGPLSRFVSFLHGTGRDVLKRIDRPIDFMYLDSDGPNHYEQNDDPPEGGFYYQKNSLEEIIAAAPMMHSGTVLLMDDDLQGVNTGKPFLTRTWLRDNGWICVLDDYQSVWIRRDRR